MFTTGRGTPAMVADAVTVTSNAATPVPVGDTTTNTIRGTTTAAENNTGKLGGPGFPSSLDEDEVVMTRQDKELISTKAQLFQRQGSGIPITTTTEAAILSTIPPAIVSNLAGHSSLYSPSHHHLAHHHHQQYSSGAAVFAAAANLVEHHHQQQHYQQQQQQQQQQLEAQLQLQLQLAAAVPRRSGGGIVAPLINQHLPHTTAATIAQTMLLSHLSTSSSSSSGGRQQQYEKHDTTARAQKHKHKHNQQYERNAKQLNPNSFQFPWKLHDMLDRSFVEKFDDIVSWVDNGKAFRVHEPEFFVYNVMPRFFKQTKYKSFQRQLNLYGFTRFNTGTHKGGYMHKFLRQGHRTMCQLIPRRGVRNKDGDDNDNKNNDDSNDDDHSINDDNKKNDNNNKNNIRQISLQSNESSGKNRNTNNCNVRRNKNSNIVSDTTNASSLPSTVVSLSSLLLAKEQKHLALNQSTEQITTTSTGISSMTPISTMLAGPTQSHQQVIDAMIAARTQKLEAAISNNFLLMGTTTATSQHLQLEKYLKEQQQIQQILGKQFEQQRIQQLLINHQKAASVMTVLRTTHSSSITTTPSSSSIATRQVITPGTSTCTTKVPDEAHNKSKVDALLSEQEKISALRNEFQFPWKLFEMLERSEVDKFSHLVGWMPGDTNTRFNEGACFKVHDTENFVQKVMPIFFKQTKYKSFQRQLNLYSFFRIDAGPNKGAYRHPSFLRGRKDMLPTIQRMKMKSKGKGKGQRTCKSNNTNNKYSRYHNLKAITMSSLQGKDQDADDADASSSSELLPSASAARKYSGIAHHHPVDVSVPPVPSSQHHNEESGINVILQAIQAREMTDNNNHSSTRAYCHADTGNDTCIHYVGDSTSSSDSDSITI